MPYRNYIFDLYDTLLHIRTDETERGFWLRLARRYAAFGAPYAPAELRAAYLRCCREAEAALTAETGCEYPEIELRDVFFRLLREGRAAKQGPVAKREEQAPPLQDVELHCTNTTTCRGVSRSARYFATGPRGSLPSHSGGRWPKAGRGRTAHRYERQDSNCRSLSLSGRLWATPSPAGGGKGSRFPSPVCDSSALLWVESTAAVFRILSRREFCLWPGAAELLARLRERGCRLYLLSNAQACFTRRELAAAGLDGAFDAVYLSSDRRMRKPQPEFLRALLDEQGLDPGETVLVGNDPLTDMAVAATCGVKGVLVNHPDGVPLAQADRVG